ncbi:MAG: carbon monoxide dehydrogenase subunit G [Acidobacteria bacterium]|nr:carbon monoxide dehydrogenase subunit G [Acidobacteriota bacterium]
MKLEGSYRLPVPRSQVWEALLNPEILCRVIPGCEKLTAAGPSKYTGLFRAGVGHIRGSFSGEVEITNIDPQNSYTLRSRMKAGVGFVDGTGDITLADDMEQPGAPSTLLNYSGEVKVGGMLASIAGRLVESAARKNLDDLFANLERELGRSAG